ncbi:MAG: IPTL-CTERM sorting domain-containing protein [Bacteroidota bacterium]
MKHFLSFFFCLLMATSGYSVADITFCVDVSCAPPQTSVNIFGGFNGWNPGANALDDPDGDDIYCTTISMPDGPQEYKFLIDGVEESFLLGPDPTDACTINSFASFVNRVITVVDGVPQNVTYGFNNCDLTCSPPPGALVTFCVNVDCVASPNSVNIFGGFNGWNSGANELEDPDGDDLYCTDIFMSPGLQEYKFLVNGVEETFPVGPDPTDVCTINPFADFVNRFVDVVDGVPQTVTYGFNNCDLTCTPPPGANIELCVDVSCFVGQIPVTVFGGFNGWNPGANELEDPDGDEIYCTTVFMTPGPQEYKFIVNGLEEEFELGPDPTDACTINSFADFVNRIVDVVDGVDQSLTYGFNACDATCVPFPGANVAVCVDMGCSGLMPNTVSIFGGFNGWNPGANVLDDSDGDGIWCGVVFMDPGPQEYKFWTDLGEESFPLGPDPTDICTINSFADFVNRYIEIVDGVDQNVIFDWNTCEAVCSEPAPIPTMGEWGLIILALLLLTFGTLGLTNRQLTFSGTSTGSTSWRSLPFNRKEYGKFLWVVSFAVVLIFAMAVVLFGYEMTNADVPGSLITIPICAYLLHLVFGKSEGEHE